MNGAVSDELSRLRALLILHGIAADELEPTLPLHVLPGFGFFQTRPDFDPAEEDFACRARKKKKKK